MLPLGHIEVPLLAPRGQIYVRLLDRFNSDDFAIGMRRYPKPVPLLFAFGERGFHPFTMKGVPFPLDMVFIDRDLVVGVLTAPANRHGPFAALTPYTTVLELAAGDARRLGLVDGVRVGGLT